ncbi:SCO family protein [bacterium CPR1]|nr:SCO family protein [bacterium CPR1]
MRALLLAALLFVGCSTPPPQAPASRSPGPLPELSIYHLPGAWTDQDGKELTLPELRGKVRLLAMVYTSCPQACPRIIADMKSIDEDLRKRHPAGVELVLVTFDPETDTPERLRQLADEQKLDPRWRLIRGDSQQVQELAAVLGVKYRKVSATDFAHSNLITVLDADGVVVHQQEGLGVERSRSIDAVEKALTSCCSEEEGP